MQGKGPDEKQGEYDLLKLVQKLEREDTIYPVDQFPGELGPYKPA